MAANQILQFCPTDTGTNLLTQSAYSAASDRTNGNQPGVASAKLNNKALRQSSLVAAALAQFMADNQATDIVDTLSATALAALIPLAIHGRIVNVQVLTSSGTYTRTAGATSGLLRAQGAGAGGAGSVTTGGTQISVGPGGGGGAFGEHFFNGNLPASQAYTIGGGGNGGTTGGGAGQAGGATVFGSLTAPGAPATSGGVAATPPVIFASGLGANPATGFNLVNSSGQVGGYAIGMTTSSLIGGSGGHCPVGSGANPNITSSANGQASPSRGGGGGGATNGASTAGFVGGSGGNGLIIIIEIA